MPQPSEGLSLSSFISKFVKGIAMPRGQYGKAQKPEGVKEPVKTPEPVKVEEKPVKKPNEPSYSRKRH